MPKVRIAVITDIHYGFDFRDKLGSKAPGLMKRFVKWAEGLKSKPDAVIDMGDRVNSKNPAEDRRFMQELMGWFKQLSMPVLHLMGNHDNKFLSAAENEEITGSPSGSYSLDIADWHLVLWNPQFASNANGITVSAEDIAWLKNDLDATVKNTAVFSHVPFFHRNEEKERIENQAAGVTSRFSYEMAPAIRKIFEESGKVRRATGGHRHENSHAVVNGISYDTLQSLTSEYQDKYKVPSGTWALIELDSDRIKTKLYGKSAMRLEGAFRKAWTTRFTPLAGSAPPPPAAPQP